ncbi:MAG TPA: DUF3040 domain-containing protein [Kutzneria sp.]|jgi:hypothetical protein|nr:DUF3040 domain-containing protein [Kutzneria sp.]
MDGTKALSARQRRCLARLDRSLAGDAVFRQLGGLFPEPARTRPRVRKTLWCLVVMTAGVVLAAAGAASGPLIGVGAAAAVVVGVTALTGALAFLLADSTGDAPLRTRSWGL